MSWQKCPVCDGSGFFYADACARKSTCPTCHGQQIINELTGKPPADPDDSKKTKQELETLQQLRKGAKE